MNDTNRFDYYYGDRKEEKFHFTRLPEPLIKDPRYKMLSGNVKILYSLMLDRLSLSRMNGWVDKKGRVFIIYTIKDIMRDMNCCKASAVKYLDMLDAEKGGIGLIERKRKGLGNPNVIYVKDFQSLSVSKTSDNGNSTGSKAAHGNTVHAKEDGFNKSLYVEKVVAYQDEEETVAVETVVETMSDPNLCFTDAKEYQDMELPYQEPATIPETDEEALATGAIMGNEISSDSPSVDDIAFVPKRDLIKNTNPELYNMYKARLGEVLDTYGENTVSDEEEYKVSEAEFHKTELTKTASEASTENRITEVQKINTVSKKQTSVGIKNELSWVQKTEPNQIYHRQTEIKETESNQSIVTKISKGGKDSTSKITRPIDGMDRNIERLMYEKFIKQNIAYDVLKQENPNDNVDGIVGLMVNTVCSSRSALYINGDETPIATVKSVFLKLNYQHMKYVIQCMKNTKSQIRNIRSYLLTVLYNALSTMGSYYQAEVQHNFAELAEGES